jgi:hypothetical protein
MRDLGERARRKVRFRQISADSLHEKQASRTRESGVNGINRKLLNKDLRKGDQDSRSLVKSRFYLERAYNVSDT